MKTVAPPCVALPACCSLSALSLRDRGNHIVRNIRLARHPAGARGCGAHKIRAVQHPDLDLVRDGMDVRPAVPILLANCAWPARRRGPVGSDLRAISVVLALIGFLRWVFAVPPLAQMYRDSDAEHCVGGGMACPAPVRWGSSWGAPWPIAGDRLVSHPQHHHHPKSGTASLARRPRLDCQRALSAQSRDILATALPGFPCSTSRVSREHRLGTLGGRTWHHAPGPAQGTSGFGACECLTG